MLAVAYDQLGSLDDAEAHYKKATQLEPDNSAASNAYAVFLCRHNRWKDAEPYFQRAVANFKYQTPEVSYTNAAVCAMNAGDHEKAEQNFRAALTRNPTYADALEGMLDMSYQDKNYMQARAFLARFRDVRPATAEVLLMCFNIEDQLKNHDAANRCAAQLREGFPDSPELATAESGSESSMAEDSRQLRCQSLRARPKSAALARALRAARDAQSITLEQVATELRIELPQLEALEGDRFERIGVPVFVKGYLRQYGTRLGLDPRDLLAQYYEQTTLKEVQVQPSKTIKLHDERQITVWVIAALAILVVIVGLAAWWVGAGGSSVATTPPAAPTGGDAKPAPAAATPGAPPPATVPPSGGSAGGPASSPAEAAPSSTPSAPAATSPPSGGAAVLSRTTTLAATAPPPSGRGPADRAKPAAPPPAAAPAASPAGAASQAAASPATAAVAATADDDGGASLVVPLELTFDQESWAEVTDARGERLYYGLGAAGKRAQMRGQPPFAVVLGNASGVKIVVDGEDFAVPAKGKPGEYARFSVNVVSD